MKKIITLAVAAAFAAQLSGMTPAHAAAIKLSLNDIVIGSETTTLVTNGDFEDNSSGNGHTPTGWGRFGNMFYDSATSPAVPNATSQVANWHVDGGGAGNYNQTVNLLADTDYVLSAYVWQLGDSTHGSTTEIDLNDATGEAAVSISQADTDANTGYFVYDTFSTTDTGTTPSVRIFGVHDGGTPTLGWPNQPDAGLWDNVAVTLASQFVAPNPAIPEPTTLALGLIGFSAAGIRRRR